MKLIFIGHKFHYELERLYRMFFPPHKAEVFYEKTPLDGDYLLCEMSDGIFTAKLKNDDFYSEKSIDLNGEADKNEKERLAALALYSVLSHFTGKTLPWGIMTGIRPVKFIGNALDRGETSFKEKYLISDEKLDISKKILDIQTPILASIPKKSFSLYISIPFCPTRCSYCSFVSQSVESAKKLIPEYVTLLCKELSEVAIIAESLGLTLDTIYIGGGTPTTLGVPEFAQIEQALKAFDLSRVREFTVEAGRPDTITEPLLRRIKAMGAGRISINPQTMRQDVLDRIGRSHSVGEVYRAFEIADKIGFDSVNADLIAGLPGDSFAGFAESLDKIIALNPNNITVHTLSLKRSSSLFRSGEDSGEQAAVMVAHAAQRLMASGFVPYYLYRQNNTADNQENIGYCKANSAGIYNIAIMEEAQTILGAGAGASTKLLGGGKIERVFNFKYPFEYITRFSELIERKKAVKTFFTANGY